MFAERHYQTIRTLAGYLSKHDFFVMLSKRMTSQEESR